MNKKESMIEILKEELNEMNVKLKTLNAEKRKVKYALEILGVKTEEKVNQHEMFEEQKGEKNDLENESNSRRRRNGRDTETKTDQQ